MGLQQVIDRRIMSNLNNAVFILAPGSGSCQASAHTLLKGTDQHTWAATPPSHRTAASRRPYRRRCCCFVSLIYIHVLPIMLLLLLRGPELINCIVLQQLLCAVAFSIKRQAIAGQQRVVPINCGAKTRGNVDGDVQTQLD